MPSFQGCCAHDHDCEEADCGPSWSLHEHIDLPRVACLNEATAGSAKHVFRAWPERLQDPETTLDSNEDDAELLITIPFNGAVKIKAISIIGGDDGSSPSRLKAYTNRHDLDFAAVMDMAPVQAWDLQEQQQASMEYPTQVAKFNGVHTLILHIPENFGADRTRVTFIGIKGDFTERKTGPVTAVYEARAMPKDHKVGDPSKTFREVGGY
ncbi:hypothetical protein WJX79_007544 [Trebouxia sp. C0005]